MTHIVIIGGGHAAAQAVSSLRAKRFYEEKDARITIVSDEPYIPYQRPPLSKGYLAGDIAAERLPILRESAYEGIGAQLVLDDPAEAIDPANKTIRTRSGKQVAFDKLIIATGGRARKLPLDGITENSVHYIRSRADIDRLIPRFANAERVAIIGGGYIGLEAASVAAKSGKSVALFERENRLLARVVAPEVSDFYARLHARHGVALFCGSEILDIAAQKEGYRLTHSQGTWDADVIIAGIGLIPNAEIAAAAGISTDAYGIMVDGYCQTNIPDIYAIGDVASFVHPLYDHRMRVESVQNAVDQAKCAVAHITGTPEPYSALPWFWSDQYDVKLQIAGISAGADQIVTRGSVDGASAAFFYLKDGRMIAADCAGRLGEFMGAKKLISAGIAVDASTLADESRPFKEIVADLLEAS